MLGAINHIAVCVANLKKSDEFWEPLMEFLGYKRTLNSESISVWESESSGSAINFWQSKEDHEYKYYAPGLHHIAFNAEKESEVDDFFNLLQKVGAQVLDFPSKYDHYEPGYYAVYFKDINGFKIELAYTPSVVVNGPKK